MDRVTIDNEPRGSATYYMGDSPHVYGERIFKMAFFKEIDIISAHMDVGREQGASWRDVNSLAEYDDIIWKTSGAEIYSCVFEIKKRTGGKDDRDGLPITVTLEFPSKRLNLQVDPNLDMREKKQLAEFFDILTDEEYFLEHEKGMIKEEPGWQKYLGLNVKTELVILGIFLFGWLLTCGDRGEPSLISTALCVAAILICTGDMVRRHLIKRASKRKLAEVNKRIAAKKIKE